jgi:hypothetical protein
MSGVTPKVLDSYTKKVLPFPAALFLFSQLILPTIFLGITHSSNSFAET